MFQISQPWFAAWPHVQINYSHKGESMSFSPQVLQLLFLLAVALPVVLKAEFNFELIMYIAILLSPSSCFKSAICIQLKS